MNFPFPADTIGDHRFHGLFQGTFVIEDERLKLKTDWGLLPLYPRQGAGGGRPHFAACKQATNEPDLVVNVYGYPRTDRDGTVNKLEVCSWFVEGSEPQKDYAGISRKFQPGQIFLCGRVKNEGPNGLVCVTVKSTIANTQRRWFFTGRCLGEVQAGSKTLFLGWVQDGSLMLQPLQVITPAGRSSSSQPHAAVRRVPQESRTSKEKPAPRSQRPSVSGGSGNSLRSLVRHSEFSEAAPSVKTSQPSQRQSQKPKPQAQPSSQTLRRPPSLALQRPQRQQNG